MTWAPTRGFQHLYELGRLGRVPAARCVQRRFDEFASQLTEALLVANLALRLDRKLVWDAEKMEVRDCPEAVAFVKRSYRTGW